MTNYPHRLIEVDLPIKRISAHARREKSIRHGHISTLHIWWARRPLAACRAVICAALWPDPADPLCPEAFRATSREWMHRWSSTHLKLLSAESLPRFIENRDHPERLDDGSVLRMALLDFIADFANWDNSTDPDYLETARALTQSAHEALGGLPGTRPLVVDPFAGGGAIPLEALRVGADAFASDLNPVAVLLNKVVLEYIPKYGQRLADEVRKWGQWIKERAEEELGEFYPKDSDGATPIAYLWARTIICEGPGCGAEIPLIRTLWLAKKPHRSVALRLIPNSSAKHVDFEIMHNVTAREVGEGTVHKGAATCPCCGYTTPVMSVRRQLKARHGGTITAREFCVVTTRPGEQGRRYRLPNQQDSRAIAAASQAVYTVASTRKTQSGLSPIPDESTLQYDTFVNRGPIYGMETWADYFTPRQLLALVTFEELIRRAGSQLSHSGDEEFATSVQVCLALSLSRLADRMSALCTWRPQADQEKIEHVFARQALQMTWDYAEGTPLSSGTASWVDAFEPPVQFIDGMSSLGLSQGSVAVANATLHPLPDSSANAVVTDPPYYFSVQYADLSDYFYVWLRRSLPAHLGELIAWSLTPKEDEIIVQSPSHQFSAHGKNRKHYESRLTMALLEQRRLLTPSGISVVVFADASTGGWEALIQAMIDSKWVITGSWPIDTEMATRVLARNRSVLASSVHLVCRPRDNLPDHDLGDWRDVLAELPLRIHSWMPRLTGEGVFGADAIFACLGPALEIFSRYARVEKASGEQVTLGEYLEHVWAAVAREALGMIFTGADASGLEEDARLTAMWLWTLSSGATTNADEPRDRQGELLDAENDADASEDETPIDGRAASSGYTLEFDAARKIAQGLGAHLERLTTLVELKGKSARLLPVAERARFLAGKPESQAPVRRTGGKKSAVQMNLFGPTTIQPSLMDVNATPAGEPAPAPAASADSVKIEAGKTTLDRVHQSMLLFAAGHSEGLKRFLVTDGVGRDERFWHLAQALSALYPASSDEKRWVDGVLGRKKGLGL